MLPLTEPLKMLLERLDLVNKMNTTDYLELEYFVLFDLQIATTIVIPRLAHQDNWGPQQR
jgi:hypothetical protein